MQIPIYQVDAFAGERFAGNPAAVCPLDRWLPDELMQQIAAENNLSETAFFVAEGERFELRWFTPTVEVDLCGHATLASGFVVLTELQQQRRSVEFATASGILSVARAESGLTMRLPANPPARADLPGDLERAIAATPSETLRAGDVYMLVYESEQQVRALAPDFALLRATGSDVIATAPGSDHDFVSRYFAPAHGIDEDPVTGSAHCVLAPYWSKRLGKDVLNAFQASRRGGELTCEARDGEVVIGGQCALYMRGTIEL